MTIRVGTSYFVTFEAACRYYRGHLPESASRRELIGYVAQKIADDETHIGEPPLKAGQYCVQIRGEGRYAVCGSA